MTHDVKGEKAFKNNVNVSIKKIFFSIHVLEHNDNS